LAHKRADPFALIRKTLLELRLYRFESMRKNERVWPSDQVFTQLITGTPIIRRVAANGVDFVLGIGAGIVFGTNMRALSKRGRHALDDAEQHEQFQNRRSRESAELLLCRSFIPSPQSSRTRSIGHERNVHPY
jgi:hypothetical protein